MQPSQTQIDFTTVLHKRENNPESEANLKENFYRFTGQCAFVFSLLQKGIRLTTRGAMVNYNIGHLPRRIKDINDALKAGQSPIIIQCEFLKDANGKSDNFKTYFIKQNSEGCHT